MHDPAGASACREGTVVTNFHVISEAIDVKVCLQQPSIYGIVTCHIETTTVLDLCSMHL